MDYANTNFVAFFRIFLMIKFLMTESTFVGYRSVPNSCHDFWPDGHTTKRWQTFRICFYLFVFVVAISFAIMVGGSFFLHDLRFSVSLPLFGICTEMTLRLCLQTKNILQIKKCTYLSDRSVDGDWCNGAVTPGFYTRLRSAPPGVTGVVDGKNPTENRIEYFTMQ